MADTRSRRRCGIAQQRRRSPLTAIRRLGDGADLRSEASGIDVMRDQGSVTERGLRMNRQIIGRQAGFRRDPDRGMAAHRGGAGGPRRYGCGARVPEQSRPRPFRRGAATILEAPTPSRRCASIAASTQAALRAGGSTAPSTSRKSNAARDAPAAAPRQLVRLGIRLAERSERAIGRLSPPGRCGRGRRRADRR